MTANTARTTIQTHLGVRADGDLGIQSWRAYRRAKRAAIIGVQQVLGLRGAALDGERGPQTDALLAQLDDSPADSAWPPPARQIAEITIAPARTDTTSRALHTPLGRTERESTFGGPFKWRHKPEPGNRENIVILGDWEEENIVPVEIPQLRQVPGNFSRMRWNKRGVEQLKALWVAWEKAGLLPLVKSYEGSYVPRLIRGSSSSLSNHAYGSAFDINYFWNQLGKAPARAGKIGSVQELVPLAHEHGFYWGGHFSRLDGMHFEICKLL